ncbi:MAG TPA: UDP-3-O-(3-hydroxymyristoyl)glucosamine N-acyltransferase [Bdellovibrionota bacterium]|jgi:UDP-3-O-[3-hydroxymyristoyl] glucosamine N-acyltransferase
MTRKNKVLLGDLLPALGLGGEGEKHRSLEIRRIAPVEKAREGDLVFVAADSALAQLKSAHPSVAVVSENLYARAYDLGLKFPLLKTKDAMLAFAKASVFFKTETVLENGVHSTAFVHPSARLGAGVTVGPHAVINEEAELENGVVVHASAEIGARAHIGADSVIFPGVVIYQDCKIGARVRIHANSVIGADGFGYVQEKTPTGVKHVKIHHLGGVRIGDDVEIGASSTIDRGTLEDTIIERGCIIDNQVQIGHNCHLEEGVIICGCTGLAGSVHVGKYAVLAGFVGVANKMTIGRGARIAAYSAIQGHVPEGVTWGGIPGMPHRDWLRTQRLFRVLPEILGEKGKAARRRPETSEEA